MTDIIDFGLPILNESSTQPTVMVSNSIITLPINCVLSGNQPMELGKTIIEYNAPNIRVIKTPI